MQIRGGYARNRGGRMAFNGKRLRTIRRVKDLTQTDLAKAAGATQRMISSYERGKDLPRADVLASICAALDVTADFLLELTNVADAPLSSDEWAMVKSSRRGNRNALDDAMNQTMLDGGSGD